MIRRDEDEKKMEILTEAELRTSLLLNPLKWYVLNRIYYRDR